MVKRKSGDLMRAFGWIGLGAGCMLLLGGSSVLYSDTLIEWWKPVAVCGLLAIISAFVYGKRWRRFTQTDFAPVNFCLQAIVAFSLLIFAFFGVNYFFSDVSDRHTEIVKVERRYSETHYRTRRVGRRVVGRGEPYHVYFVEVRFRDGRLKSLPILKREYDRTHTGDSIPLDIEKGYLDIPVIKTRLSSKQK